MGIRRLGKSRNVQRLLWAAVILSPLLAGVVLGWFSGAGVSRYEAWNTKQNDEMGYYSAVVTLRETGLPMGVNSYDEVPADYPAYGAYNYVTYFPLFLASLVTGWTGHNMIVYANVLLMVLAWGCTVLILRPSAGESLCLILFTVLNFSLSVYTWSGMNEAVCCFLAMAAMSLALWLIRGPAGGGETRGRLTAAAYAALVFAVFLGGLIRPFMLAYLPLPLICLSTLPGKRGKKTVLSLLTLAAAVLSLALFAWMSAHLCAPYFQERPTLQVYADLLKQEGFRGFLESIRNRNILAAEYVFQQLKAWHPVGVVTLECVALCLLSGYSMLRFRKRDRKKAWLSAVCIVAFLVFFEANVLFNVANWLDRMLLPLLCSGAVFFTFLHPEGRRIEAKAYLLLLGLAAAVSVIGGSVKAFAFPQRDDRGIDDAALARSLVEAIPKDTEDAWNNTVATTYRGTSWVRYCMPSYAGISLCYERYLFPAIRDGAVKSGYILAAEKEEDLKILCEEAGYLPVWEDCGFTLYRVVLPPPMIRAELLGDREIVLRLAGGTRKYGAGTEYAWKVYLGGEHLEEYDRAFDPQASYQLLLAQDGIYRFELVIRQGNEMLSILSEEYPVSHEVDILRAGERTVLLNYTGPAAEADGASFAWHVYRNGERVSESERSYQQIPAHFVQLEADGTYTFKCFCMVSGEKRSVLSFPVTVKNGCIEDDPRLGEISMEDAVRLTKPEVEILATITESRTVRLTVIDNSLNAGPEYTYAWYVYRGGERLREYDRGYSADPEYDLILAEDGEYTFKLFYRTGDSRKSVVSETFSIGEAGYSETD